MIPISPAPRRILRSLTASTALTLLALMLLSGCGGDDTTPKSPKKGGTDSAVAGVGAAGDSTHDASGFQQGDPVAPQAAFTLRLAPHVGDVYRYRLTQKGINEIDSVRGTEETTYWFTEKVTGINSDSSFTLEMRYDSIVSKKTLPAGVVDSVAKTFAYDTRRKIDSSVPDAAQAKAIIGHRVNVTISKRGEVREVSNIDPILSAILGNKRDSVSPEMLERLRDGLKVSAFQSIVQQIYLQVMPDTAVHVGSAWAHRDSVPLMTGIAAIPSRSKVSCTLAEAKTVGEQTLGRVTMSLATEFPQKQMENPQLITIVDQARATGTGEVVIDVVTGYPVHKSTKMDVALRLTAKGKGKAAGKTKTVSQVKSNTTIVDLVEYTRGAGEK